MRGSEKALAYHPDRGRVTGMTVEEATEAFKEIRAATIHRSGFHRNATTGAEAENTDPFGVHIGKRCR